MAKSQKRSNREVRKPKAKKPAGPATEQAASSKSQLPPIALPKRKA